MPDDTKTLVNDLPAAHPLFSLLCEKTLGRCAAAAHRASYRVGETIFQAGHEGDAACFVLEGRVRIIRTGTQSGMSLGTFGRGAFFGAHARPEQWLRTTSCRAAEDCEVLHWPRSFFEQLLEEFPDLRSYLDKSVEEAVLAESLGLSRLLAAVPGSELIEAVGEFEDVRYAAGQTIVREGEPGDALFVLRRGRLEVRRLFHDGERRLRDLLPGDYFGERALVLGAPRSSTVAALDDCECFKLDRAHFDRLRESAPTFTRQLTAKFAVYEATEKDAAQHADVWLVPFQRNHFQTAEGASRAAALGAGMPQHRLLALMGLTEFFRGAAAAGVPTVLSCLQSVRFDQGARIPDDGLYVIRTGSVRVRRGRGAAWELGPGESFGASHGLPAAEQPRPGAAEETAEAAPRFVAAADVEAYLLDRRALGFLHGSVPQWTAFVRRLADREATRTANHDAAPKSAPAQTTAQEPQERRARRTDEPHDSLARRRPRWVGQSSPNSCGLAALAMVLAAHGLPGDYRQLKKQAGLLPRGLTMLQMRSLAETCGLAVEFVQALADELTAADLPAIALWDDGHYVVLFRLGKSACLVGDPAVGLVRISHRRMRRFWSGRLLRLRPAAPCLPTNIDTTLDKP
jgi:CRP-like cAMP-binding protein